MCKQADTGVSVQENVTTLLLKSHLWYTCACYCWLCRLCEGQTFSRVLHFTAPKRLSLSSTSSPIIAGAGLDGVALKCLPENPGWPRGLGNNIKVFLYTVPGPLAHWVRHEDKIMQPSKRPASCCEGSLKDTGGEWEGCWNSLFSWHGTWLKRQNSSSYNIIPQLLDVTSRFPSFSLSFWSLLLHEPQTRKSLM